MLLSWMIDKLIYFLQDQLAVRFERPVENQTAGQKMSHGALLSGRFKQNENF